MDRKVSLVIVSHNLNNFLEKCIQQLDECTEKGLLQEIIIIDNGSEPQYLLKELARLTTFPVSLIRLEANTSFSRANNTGVSAAKGYYICFMNNDVEVLSGWLPPLYKIIDTDIRIGAVGPKMIFPDGSIQFAGYEMDPVTRFQRHRFRTWKESHLIAEANKAGPTSALAGACLLARKDDAAFDEQYWYGCEDVDLCIQLKQKNKVIYYQPQSVVIHHEEKTRSSGVVVIDFERNRDLFKKKWGRRWEKLLWKIVS